MDENWEKEYLKTVLIESPLRVLPRVPRTHAERCENRDRNEGTFHFHQLGAPIPDCDKMPEPNKKKSRQIK